MKAYVLHGINDLRFESVSEPKPVHGEALIAVKAVGICGSDIPRIFQTGAHVHPIVPGHEFSGVVVSVADDENRHWINKRVGIFPLIPCHHCRECDNRHYEMCNNYSYIGSRRDGAFAEYVTVPIKNLIEIPENVSFEETAMLEPMSVAVHAIRRFAISKSEVIAIWGLGTIGLLIAMFLKDVGHENIIFIGKKDIQRKFIAEMGFSVERFCDIRIQDSVSRIKQLTDNNGVDVFFECVGKNDTITSALECAKPLGKIILIGNPFGDIMLERNAYWKILRHQLFVTGTWNSSFLHSIDDDWHYVIEKLDKGRIAPSSLITHKLPFDKLFKGLNIMRDKTEDYCKIILALD